ncbi:MAG TPA: UDP-N-acetylmuramate dehydrogenase [Gemmatimonadales bacterium]|nr:UDP-N-acetylmuramate dehydrogenase [Gemmatimonadales bacterium]
MIAVLADELARAVRGRVRRDVPLARYTTYRIGGPAAVLVEPADAGDVARALDRTRDAGSAWMALGLGSNLLVSDAGFPGVVIRVGRGLDAVESDGPAWRVGAGLPTPILARRSAEAGFAGVHRLVGVPGTVGGGVFMNAGAHGQEFRDVVRRVRLARPDGSVEDRAGADIPWRYRSAGLDQAIVLEADLALEPADPRRLRAEIAAHLAWRKAGTPFNEPCCGSVFRNPGAGGDGESGGRRRTAGQLIDAAGMKGFRIGGAQVSPLHANYIVNVGGATADDVLRVIEAVRERVRSAFGVVLELEVKLVGLRGG